MLTGLGYPALSLDPLAARWGELGSLRKEDVLFLLSKSGATEEIIKLIPFFRSKQLKLVAVSCVRESPLSSMCDVVISLPLERELCPFNLSPATSPTLYLLLVHICTHTLLKQTRCVPNLSNFPSNVRGRQLTLRVQDIMAANKCMTSAAADLSCLDAIPLLNRSGKGFVLVQYEVGVLDVKKLGIFTDGDLRRAVGTHGYNALNMKLSELSTKPPRCIQMGDMALSALDAMNMAPTVSFLVVLDMSGLVQGIITRHQIVDAELVDNR